MEEELIARLLGEASLTDLVGDRISLGQRNQGDPLPALTILEISPGRRYLHSGADKTGDPRIQFDSYGATSADALAVRKALTAILETRKTQGTVNFSVSLLDAERGPIIEDNGGGSKVHRYSSDFIVWFSRAA